MKNKSLRVLSVFSLVMINIIAVDSLRTLPISAEYGLSLITYYLVAALLFFIPTALVTAELATTWPKTGGIYVWVREAFGQRIGFLVIWVQWIYNVVWYPAILSFVASMIAYIIDPNLIHDKTFMIITILLLFWGATLLNFIGMEVSSAISTIGSVAGTLAPMLLIIGLAGYWLVIGNPIQMKISTHALIPKVNSLGDLVLFSGILYGLVGLEMSAVHASEVKNPSRDYPRALLISSVIILFTLMLASLAIALVVPQKSLSLVAGIIQAFAVFFDAVNMPYMTPILAGLMVIGGIASVATWIIGPTKGMLAASRDGVLPKIFAKTNTRGVPTNILLIQALIYSALSLVYLLMPTVNASYWLLTELTAQLALLMYIIMFIAAIRLRYNKSQVIRPFAIGFANKGMWAVAGTGALCSFLVILLGFIPPSHVEVGNRLYYQLILAGGIIIFCSPPFFLIRMRKTKGAIGRGFK